MKRIILFISFVCYYANISAQVNNTLNRLIVQSVDKFYHHFDSSKNESIRETYSNCTRYVCKKGLPLDFNYDSPTEYVFHDDDYDTIKKLSKHEKDVGIATVYVNLSLNKDIIIIIVSRVSLSPRSSKKYINMLHMYSLTYSYKYDSSSGKWLEQEKETR